MEELKYRCTECGKEKNSSRFNSIASREGLTICHYCCQTITELVKYRRFQKNNGLSLNIGKRECLKCGKEFVSRDGKRLCRYCTKRIK